MKTYKVTVAGEEPGDALEVTIRSDAALDESHLRQMARMIIVRVRNDIVEDLATFEILQEGEND